ncbi:hypothetical protein HUT16_05475 [Kitasatospora sp. NA04385]|uniref:hypothetical protein n=1 Tax=Kitasatospora sp. NA04385 TaxID=2742135 RepID=UPI0015923B9B|nr:hypothetical protein [Kitasatospora sp. NA04385]QKW18587.1 hypothetical protein HUT16_05475 [Kitasatospora sp. NA04385]
MPSSRRSKLASLALATAIAASGAIATTAVTIATATTAQAASSVGGQITRSEVLSRANDWYNRNIPYNQGASATDVGGRSYRSDCSGFVSMAWHLGSSENTDSLDVRSLTSRVALTDLQPGDALDNDPGDGNIAGNGHIVLFDHWVNKSAGTFAYIAEANTADDMQKGTGTVGSGTFANYFGLRYNNIADDPVTGNTVRLVNVKVDGGVRNVDGNFSSGQWGSWSDMGTTGVSEVTSAATGSTLRVFAIGSDNRIYEKDGNFATGQWSASWFPLQNSPTVTAISASSYGNTVHLTAIGTDGQMHNSDGDYTAGNWNGWTAHGGTNLKRIASATTSDNVNHVFVLDSNQQLREIDANYATGQWGSWGAAAGGFTGKDVAASAYGRTVHLTALDNNGQLFNNDGDFAAGTWTGWTGHNGTGLKRITSATSTALNINHIFAVNAANRLVEMDANYTTGIWNSWAEPAGGTDSQAVTATFTN